MATKRPENRLKTAKLCKELLSGYAKLRAVFWHVGRGDIEFPVDGEFFFPSGACAEISPVEEERALGVLTEKWLTL